MKALARLLPTPATVALLFVFPLLLCGYFVFTNYSDQILTNSEVSYLDYQADFLTNFLLTQSWVNWFNELLDFAIWGVVAAVALVSVWAFGAARVAVENHYAQQNFLNFNTAKTSWHGKFWVVTSIRMLLVGIIIYCVITMFIRTIPELSQHVEKAVQGLSLYSFQNVLVSVIKLVFSQYIIAISISVFRHLNSE